MGTFEAYRLQTPFFSSSFFFICLFLFFFGSFFTLYSQDNGRRRLEESFSELRQPRKEWRHGARARQQKLDQDGQRLQSLQQDLHFHRRRHHVPEILRQQGQAHHF